jgi:hypothetical protein
MYQCHSDRHDVINYNYAFPFTFFICVLLREFRIPSYQQQPFIERRSSVTSATFGAIF